MTIKKELSGALAKLIHGVYIISTKNDGKVNAMTAAWVARASFEPPLITIAIGNTRHSHEMIKKSGVFAVNVLSIDNILLGKHFGFKSGKKTDKFADMAYDVKVTGAPILKDCTAWIDCKVVSSIEAGDHTIFIGECLDGGVVRDADTLVYDKEKFWG